MKLNPLELIHRFIFLVISIAWTVMFFLFMEDYQGFADRIWIFITGILGFIVLGRYDIKVFKGKWI